VDPKCFPEGFHLIPQTKMTKSSVSEWIHVVCCFRPNFSLIGIYCRPWGSQNRQNTANFTKCWNLGGFRTDRLSPIGAKFGVRSRLMHILPWQIPPSSVNTVAPVGRKTPKYHDIDQCFFNFQGLLYPLPVTNQEVNLAQEWNIGVFYHAEFLLDRHILSHNRIAKLWTLEGSCAHP